MTRKIGCPCPSNCHRTLCFANPFGKADAKVHTFCKPTKYFNTFFEKNYDTLFIYRGKQGKGNAFPKKHTGITEYFYIFAEKYVTTNE